MHENLDPYSKKRKISNSTNSRPDATRTPRELGDVAPKNSEIKASYIPESDRNSVGYEVFIADFFGVKPFPMVYSFDQKRHVFARNFYFKTDISAIDYKIVKISEFCWDVKKIASKKEERLLAECLYLKLWHRFPEGSEKYDRTITEPEVKIEEVCFFGFASAYTALGQALTKNVVEPEDGEFLLSQNLENADLWRWDMMYLASKNNILDIQP